MKQSKNRSSGFGVIGVVFLIASLLLIVGTGAVVYKLNNNQAETATNSSEKSPVATPQAKSSKPEVSKSDADAFPNTQTYTNEKYGVSFRYPNAWKIDEVPVPDPSPVVPIEYSINIKDESGEKYSSTAVLGIIARDYDSVISYFATKDEDNQQLKLSKSDGTFQGKKFSRFTQSFPNLEPAPSKSEQYFYDLGSKTYSLESINTELNVQRDENYWDKFNIIVDTLKLP